MPYTRRDILKLAALVSLSPWLPACAPNDPNTPTIKPTTTSNSPVTSDSTPQVIVIGAGIAGLAAAAKLKQTAIASRSSKGAIGSAGAFGQAAPGTICLSI